MALLEPPRLPVPVSAGPRAWVLCVVAAVLVEIAQVALHILYIVIYSYAIDPGHVEAWYVAHAQVSGPWFAVLAGMPLMYLAGRWLGPRVAPSTPRWAALATWATWAGLDVSLLIAMSAGPGVAWMAGLSMATKLAAVLLGARAAERAMRT